MQEAKNSVTGIAGVPAHTEREARNDSFRKQLRTCGAVRAGTPAVPVSD